MADDFLSGVSIGGNIAAEAMNRNLRYQQLKSEDALRQANERRANQALALQLQAHAQQVDFQAQAAKASAAFQALTSPTVEFEGDTLPNTSQLPPSEAFSKTFLPVFAKSGNPQQLEGAVRALTSMQTQEQLSQYRQNNLQERADLQSDRLDSLESRNQATIDSRFKLQDQKQAAQIDALAQKQQNALEILDLKQAQESKMQDLKNSARLAIAQGQVSAQQFYNRHLNTVVNDIRNTRAGAKLSPEQVTSQALTLLKDAYTSAFGERQLGDSGAATPTALPSTLSTSKVRVINPSGKTGFIPASQLEEALKSGYKKAP